MMFLNPTSTFFSAMSGRLLTKERFSTSEASNSRLGAKRSSQSGWSGPISEHRTVERAMQVSFSGSKRGRYVLMFSHPSPTTDERFEWRGDGNVNGRMSSHSGLANSYDPDVSVSREMVPALRELTTFLRRGQFQVPT